MGYMLKTDEDYMTTVYQETLHTNEEYVQCTRYKMCAWMNRHSTVMINAAQSYNAGQSYTDMQRYSKSQPSA